MRRMLPIGVLALVLSCQAAPEPRSAVTPLPDKGPPLSYAQLLERCRTLATNATEALVKDSWTQLEDIAANLEQTASYLARADDVPAKHKDTLPTISGDLAKLARALKEAARAKNADKCTEVMTSINRKVREMRLSNGT